LLDSVDVVQRFSLVPQLVTSLHLVDAILIGYSRLTKGVEVTHDQNIIAAPVEQRSHLIAALEFGCFVEGREVDVENLEHRNETSIATAHDLALVDQIEIDLQHRKSESGLGLVLGWRPGIGDFGGAIRQVVCHGTVHEEALRVPEDDLAKSQIRWVAPLHLVVRSTHRLRNPEAEFFWGHLGVRMATKFLDGQDVQLGLFDELQEGGNPLVERGFLLFRDAASDIVGSNSNVLKQIQHCLENIVVFDVGMEIFVERNRDLLPLDLNLERATQNILNDDVLDRSTETRGDWNFRCFLCFGCCSTKNMNL